MWVAGPWAWKSSYMQAPSLMPLGKWSRDTAKLKLCQFLRFRILLRREGHSRLVSSKLTAEVDIGMDYLSGRSDRDSTIISSLTQRWTLPRFLSIHRRPVFARLSSCPCRVSLFVKRLPTAGRVTAETSLSLYNVEQDAGRVHESHTCRMSPLLHRTEHLV